MSTAAELLLSFRWAEDVPVELGPTLHLLLSLIHQDETVLEMDMHVEGDRMLSASCGSSGGAELGGRLALGLSQHATYCMAKPIMTLLYGHLIDQGEISFDDRVGDILASSDAVGMFTVADYLAHEVAFSRGHDGGAGERRTAHRSPSGRSQLGRPA